MNIKEKVNKLSPIISLVIFACLGIAVTFLIPITDLTTDENIRILLISYVVVFSAVSIIGTLIMYLKLKLDRIVQGIITGLSVGMGIGTVIIVTGLVF